MEDYIYIDIDSIRVEDNVRSDLPEISELAASIRAVGQRTPVEVVRDGDGYVLLTGHRRYAAIRSIGMAAIRAIVVEADSRPAAQIAENVHVALSIYDQIEAFCKLADEGHTAGQIAAIGGVTAKHANNLLRIARLPAETLERLRAVGAPASVAIACAAKGADVNAIIRAHEKRQRALAADGRKRAPKAAQADEAGENPSRTPSRATIARAVEALEEASDDASRASRARMIAMADALRWAAGMATMPAEIEEALAE